MSLRMLSAVAAALIFISVSLPMCVSKTVGCAGFGLLEGTEDDMDQEGCDEFVRRMALPFLPRNGHARDPRPASVPSHTMRSRRALTA